MVLATMKIPQLRLLNEVIDVPGMQVAQVLPSRWPVKCNDRCLPQLQFINKVVHTPVEAQCLIPMALHCCRPLGFPCCCIHGG